MVVGVLAAEGCPEQRGERAQDFGGDGHSAGSF
jgi:hypothetical protein